MERKAVLRARRYHDAGVVSPSVQRGSWNCGIRDTRGDE